MEDLVENSGGKYFPTKVFNGTWRTFSPDSIVKSREHWNIYDMTWKSMLKDSFTELCSDDEWVSSHVLGFWGFQRQRMVIVTVNKQFFIACASSSVPEIKEIQNLCMHNINQSIFFVIPFHNGILFLLTFQ